MFNITRAHQQPYYDTNVVDIASLDFYVLSDARVLLSTSSRIRRILQQPTAAAPADFLQTNGVPDGPTCVRVAPRVPVHVCGVGTGADGDCLGSRGGSGQSRNTRRRRHRHVAYPARQSNGRHDAVRRLRTPAAASWTLHPHLRAEWIPDSDSTLDVAATQVVPLDVSCRSRSRTDRRGRGRRPQRFSRPRRSHRLSSKT